MQSRGFLIVISGPSGVGKGTLCKALLSKFHDLKYSVSMTTRPPRTGEVEGREYFFLSEEEFLERVEKKEFIEWAKVYENYYGTPAKEIEMSLIEGENVMLEIDMQGAMQVKNKFPEGIFVFIAPPNKKELEQRISGRGTESKEKVRERLDNLNKELQYVYEYDYVVINDSFDEALKRLSSIYIAEKCRPARLAEKLEGDLF